MIPTLITQRLALRAWRPEDLEAYQAMSADVEVMQFIGDGNPRSDAESAVSFERMMEGWRKHGFGIFAVEHLESGSLIGLCGVEQVDPAVQNALGAERAIEIGWRLDRSRWGEGFATEAARAAADWAFSAEANLDLARLLAIVQVNNDASIRIANRLGMTRERRTIVPGHQRWIDVFEVSRTSWLSPSENHTTATDTGT